VTGSANVEEDFADNAVWSMNLLSRDKQVMPWRIEDEMKRLGANYVQGGMWRGSRYATEISSPASRISQGRKPLSSLSGRSANNEQRGQHRRDWRHASPNRRLCSTPAFEACVTR
jgi:hypothetical protein